MTYKNILLAVTFSALVQNVNKFMVRKHKCMCDTAIILQLIGHRGTYEWTGTN
jgi:hypothetical protein